MGWWQVEGSEDELGDGPVDRVQYNMEIFPAGGQKPTFQHFVDSLMSALQLDGPGVLADPEQLAHQRLRARFTSPTPDLVSHPPADNKLRERLCAVLYRIGDEYEMGVGRKPRLSEILRTFAFSLRSQPERYFSGAKGLKLVTLVVEPV